jgi:hypothetical protein
VFLGGLELVAAALLDAHLEDYALVERVDGPGVLLPSLHPELLVDQVDLGPAEPVPRPGVRSWS